MPVKTATPEQIGLVRDAFLEGYVRRNPIALPSPDTSIYATLESCAATIANLIFTDDPEEALKAYLEEDRQEVISPEPDPLAYQQLETREGEPHPDREPDAWPCFEKADGSY